MQKTLSGIWVAVDKIQYFYVPAVTLELWLGSCSRRGMHLGMSMDLSAILSIVDRSPRKDQLLIGLVPTNLLW